MYIVCYSCTPVYMYMCYTHACTCTCISMYMIVHVHVEYNVHVHVFYLLSNFLHSTNRCAIEVVLVVSSLNEEVGLDVFLHLFHTRHKVVVSPVGLPITRLTGCVWREREGEEEGEGEGEGEEEGEGEGEGETVTGRGGRGERREWGGGRGEKGRGTIGE